MGILLDLIVIGIIALATFLGYKKGLVSAVFSILSIVIAIVLSLILFKPISNFVIDNTTIDEQIEASIVEIIEGQETNASDEQKEKLNNTPNVIVTYINATVTDATTEARIVVAKTVSRDITTTIVNIAIFIIIYIITKIILVFIKALTELITNIPIIKQFNELGGLIYGVLEGFFIVYVLLAIASFVLPMLNNTALLETINNTFITSILYNNNLLLMIFF